VSTTLYVTSGASFYDSTTAPDWSPTNRYNTGDIVARCGRVYRAVRAPQENTFPGDRTRTWQPIDYAVMPYRPNREYAEGSFVYSTATGEVWRLYEDGEWGSFATIPPELLAELRGEIIGRATSWQEAMD